MNRSKIEWCDHTLNIVTGCRHNCPYCYARKMSVRFAGNIKANMKETDKFRLEDGVYVLDDPFIDESGRQVHYPFGFEPTFHRYRMGILGKLKMGQNIFVGAMADLFGDWVPQWWIEEVFRVCGANPKHNYMFLTKNAVRYADLHLPDWENMFYGTSITRNDDTYLAYFLPANRRTFLSIEPLLDDVRPEEHAQIYENVDWVIIGAETGMRKDKVTPKKEWVDRIVEMCDAYKKPVFMKDSLLDIVGVENMRRDFPPQLCKRELSDKMAEKIMGNCVECGGEFRKDNMVSLTARTKRGGRSNCFAYMCKECFRNWCREHELKIPKLEGLNNEKEKLQKN